MFSLEDVIDSAPEIAGDAQYWLVRTDGGSLYNAFLSTQSIAIGYGEIDLKFIDSLPTDDSGLVRLKDRIDLLYPPKTRSDGTRGASRAGLAASQILRFCREMKGGDYVIIPSEKTEKVTIGVLTSDPPFQGILSYSNETFGEFSKRRKVRWIKSIEKSQLNPNLFKLFVTQQTIGNANDYGKWIDATLYDFFKKGDRFHYLLRVRTEEDINATTLFAACLELFREVDEFAKKQGYPGDTSEVDTRINLNSPGDVEFWSHAPEIISLIAVMVLLINGGGLKVKWGGFNFDLTTPGLINKINDFFNDDQRRKNMVELRKKIDKLNITESDQLERLLKVTQKKDGS